MAGEREREETPSLPAIGRRPARRESQGPVSEPKKEVLFCGRRTITPGEMTLEISLCSQ